MGKVIKEKTNLLAKIRWDITNILPVSDLIIKLSKFPEIEFTVKDYTTHLNMREREDITQEHPVVKVKLTFFPFADNEKKEMQTETINLHKTSKEFREQLFEGIEKLKKYFWDELKYEIILDDED